MQKFADISIEIGGEELMRLYVFLVENCPENETKLQMTINRIESLLYKALSIEDFESLKNRFGGKGS